jgi:predicted anti-sigma-YlaC factor YlaD
MSCYFNQAVLHQYLDREMDTLLTLILEEHLIRCPECRKVLNQLKILDWNLRFEDDFEVPREELKKLRTKALDTCFGEEEAKSLRNLYRIQAQAALNAVNYMHYIPGTSLLKKTGLASGKLLRKKLLASVGR